MIYNFGYCAFKILLTSHGKSIKILTDKCVKICLFCGDKNMLYNNKNYTEKQVAIDTGSISYYTVCSPYPDDDVGFNWLNYSYPYWHKHDHWELLVITEGHLLHSINNQQMIMQKGDMCLICPNDNHRIDFVSDEYSCKHLSFCMKNDYTVKLLSAYGQNVVDNFANRSHVQTCKLSEEKLYNVINTALNFKSFNMSVEDKVFQCKLIVANLINTLLQLQFDVTTPMPTWMTEFLFYINNPFLDVSNVQELAQNTPYSYSRLAHIFKDTTGITIIEYIARVKMGHAQELLKSSDMSVLEIATRLNYDSISNFNGVFKRITGITPTEYRKRHRYNT